jgi:hypothetical protein
MENMNFTKGDLTGEVNVDLDALGPVVMDKVNCRVYNIDIVTKDNRCRR